MCLRVLPDNSPTSRPYYLLNVCYLMSLLHATHFVTLAGIFYTGLLAVYVTEWPSLSERDARVKRRVQGVRMYIVLSETVDTHSI